MKYELTNIRWDQRYQSRTGEPLPETWACEVEMDVKEDEVEQVLGDRLNDATGGWNDGFEYRIASPN